MLMLIVSSVVSAWFAFFLPCYGTFKALSHRPVSEPELERWAMYWAVVGAFTAVEYVGEWLWSWFPFYWEIKIVFLLFLSLPQTEGSSYLYNSYLKPFFTKNEADIDAAIVSAQSNTIAFLQSRLTMLWEILWGILNKTPVTNKPPAAGAGQPASAPPAPNPVETAKNLWSTYGPFVMGALSKGATPPSGAAVTSSQASTSSTPTTESESPSPAPYQVESCNAPPPFPEPQLH